ncbi:class III lanthionine synthetase LanKC [Paenibacillus sp. GSMTC-2017]|uniref:class III lanthionine synthetase LanKC n=1 Tax=Paenibacillus sp. GSMTC-2017 TaxID=2794350 RepID=UPI0018D9076C|nr:class III lanthionine synthetase LanKC [Paenibacillus sp. GSMTC-2017]
MTNQSARRYLLTRTIQSDWYDSMDRYLPSDELLRVVQPNIPENWTSRRKNVWYYVTPVQYKQPRQGWKIHISSIPNHCQDVLRITALLCIEHNIPFKFLLDTRLVMMTGGKVWSREAGGKFITIYPPDLAQFKSLIHLLHQGLQDYRGPYILTDRQYKDSRTVYYRYGGFDGYYQLTPEGDKKHFLVSPEGDNHPDHRLPYFTPPAWAEDPFPPDTEETDEEMALNNGRYLVEEALNYTMLGGVYVAIDQTTGKQVVIKEAKPNTHVSEDGNDATDKLYKEYQLLQLLADTQVAAQPIDFFQDWEHKFLVEEKLPGMPLNRFIVTQTPWKYSSPNDEIKKTYLEKLRKIWMNTAKSLSACHAKHIVFCDLSITNIMVIDDEEGLVRLIDLEAGYRSGIDQPTKLITPGYNSPTAGDKPQFEDDIYSLGATMLATLLPMNMLLDVNKDKKEVFIDSLTADLGVPDDMAQIIRECMSNDAADRPTATEVADRLGQICIQVIAPLPTRIIPKAELLDTVDKMVHYIKSSAEYHRDDRLYPSDPVMFFYNPLNVAHGATGVAYALNKLTGAVPTRALHWILSQSIHNKIVPPGLYSGWSGISWALWESGVHDSALQMMRKIENDSLIWKSANLYSGASGYGLTCLYFYLQTQEAYWLNRALAVGEHLLSTKVEHPNGCYWLDHEGAAWHGYAKGSSGVAMFLLYLYKASGEEKYMELGEAALAFELSFAKEIEEGHTIIPRGLVFESENVLSHYWIDGSAGVATVLLRYWVVTQKETYRHQLDNLATDTCKKYTNFPSLFQGSSGLGNFLLDFYQFTGDDRYLHAAHRIANGVLLYQLEKPEGIAFPGEQLMRISVDFATGSSGIALFLHRLAHSDQKLGNFNFTLDELIINANLEQPVIDAAIHV